MTVAGRFNPEDEPEAPPDPLPLHLVGWKNPPSIGSEVVITTEAGLRVSGLISKCEAAGDGYDVELSPTTAEYLTEP